MITYHVRTSEDEWREYLSEASLIRDIRDGQFDFDTLQVLELEPRNRFSGDFRDVTAWIAKQVCRGMSNWEIAQNRSLMTWLENMDAIPVGMSALAE